MIIAVNTRLLIPGKIEGIGRFALETLRIITRDHPEHQFVFMFDRKYSDEVVFSSNVIPVRVFPPARHPLLWIAFFEYGIPPVIRKFKADLFLSPDGWLSLRTGVLSLPVIHDLNFLHFPQFIPFQFRQYYNYYFPRFAAKACRIATVSEFTRNDLSDKFGVDAGKIDVVYNGATGFTPANEQIIKEIRNKYTGGDPYFVFVGLIHPRKNLAGLFLAYDRFRQECNSNVRLLVVGARKWWTGEMQQAYENSTYRSDIIFTGRLPDDEVRKITASALGMVYISWFEGFGIPVLEAMNCDVPVICSSTSSLPEVGGNAVLYADPGNVESVKSAMIRLYKDSGLRNSLIEKARVRREKFSWEKTAQSLWTSVEKCAK